MADFDTNVAHLPIYALEAELLRHPQIPTPIRHDFCVGLYARTMTIPAGTCATGAVHRFESYMVLRSGTMLVATDNGAIQVEAGYMALTEAGTKRAVVAVTDCVVTTFHANPTNIADPEALWEHYTVPPAPEMLDAARYAIGKAA